MRRLSIFPSRPVQSDASVRSLYARVARGWQKGLERIGYAEAYRDLCARAHSFAPLTGPARILDAGAGTGALSAAFVADTSAQCQVDLLDLSPEMLDLAQINVGADCRRIVGPLGMDDVTIGQYDRVLCGHVIEHCEDPQAALDWLFDCLRPGGLAVFAISKPHWCTALVRWKYGSAAFEPVQAEQMLERAGFCRVTRRRHVSGPPSRISCGYLAVRT